MKKTLAVCIIAVEILGFLSCFGALLNYLIEKVSPTTVNPSAVDYVTFQADELPYNDPKPTEEDTAEADDSESITAVMPWTKIENLAQKIEDYLQYFTSDNAIYYYPAIEVSRFWDKLCGKNVTTAVTGMETDWEPLLANVYTHLLTLSDGRIVGCVSETDSLQKAVMNSIQEYKPFYEYLQSKNIQCLALYLSQTFDESDPAYQRFADVYGCRTEAEKAEIQTALDGTGIPMVDFLEVYPEVTQNFSDYFYKTDHHWLPQTGLMAGRAIADRLNIEYGYNIDLSIFDIENYDTSYHSQWLGSFGRRVTRAYCDMEDFTLLQPLYETDLEVYYQETDKTISGSIATTLLGSVSPEAISLYKYDPYGYYGGGDQPLILIHNNQVQDGTHIMILKDSYANTVYPFMAAGVEDMDVVDLRHYTGSLKSLIEERKPDTVLLLYCGLVSYTPKDFR